MAGKNSRIGKRPAPSSSISTYCAPVIVFVAFCIVGVWMFTSSSSVMPSQATTTRLSSSSTLRTRSPRVVAYRQSTPSEDDSVGELDSIKAVGDDDDKSRAKISSVVEEKIEKSEEEQEKLRKEELNEVRPVKNEENSEVKSVDDGSGSVNGNGNGEENNESGVEKEQEQLQQSEEQIRETQTTGNVEEGQQMQDENGSNDSQQQRNQPEINEDVQKKIEEVSSENQPQVEEKTEESGGNGNAVSEQSGAAEGGSGNEQNGGVEGVSGNEPVVDAGGSENEKNVEVGGNGNEQNAETEVANEKNGEPEAGNGNEQSAETEGSNGNEKTAESEGNKSSIVEAGSGNEQNVIAEVGNENEKNGEPEGGNGNEQNVPEGGNGTEKNGEAEASSGAEKTGESEGGSGNEKNGESRGGDGGNGEQQNEGEKANGSSNEGGSPTDNSEEVQQQQSEDNQAVEPNVGEVLKEAAGNKSQWATQADHSDNEKERRKEEAALHAEGDIDTFVNSEWELCNVTAGPDYIPCLDNEKALKQLHSFKHFEHRERHCPEESPLCLVPLPKGYKQSIEWPQSRDRIWYNNVPHTKLAEVKGHQNWVKVTGEHLTFPGGGTQFIHGALHYIDFIEKSVKEIAWGKHTRVILDVGCGVASFGGYLFERDVVAISFAPKDEHEAQVQFALERGIPAISAVMGSQRLQFPSKVFDIVHCARCRVPWHADGGTLLLELNRVLRPGGYFVWSATPVYQNLKEDVEIWNAMKELTKSMCWDLVTIQKDKLNSVGNAFFRKPTSNECYEKRKEQTPPMCKEDDDPNAAWYIPMKACMHRVPVDPSERGSRWPEPWPLRLQAAPYWLNNSMSGVYGRPAPDDFTTDYKHWKRVVQKSYLNGFGINWAKVRNVMDMRAIYGGFAAALRDMKVWVMNTVNIDDPDTLPVIFERGLFGIYHDWCESFSTYPRTYDLLHADHLFSRIKNRCKIVSVVVEIDRIVRPGGKIIVRDDPATVNDVEKLLKSLHWEIRLTFSKNQEGVLYAEKTFWRPVKFAESS